MVSVLGAKTAKVPRIPSQENKGSDWESRNVNDSSEWKFSHNIFHKICQKWGTPKLDLFASRHNHQLREFYSWKDDPYALKTDAFRQNWRGELLYGFPPFCLIGKTLQKTKLEQAEMILITPHWVTQSWYSTILSMTIQNPLKIRTHKFLLTNPKGEPHPLIKIRKLNLIACKISGKTWLQKEYLRNLPTLSHVLEERELELITNPPGENFMCNQQKLDPFRCPITAIMDFLADLFELGLAYRTINNHRSAISAYHEKVEGLPTGKHQLVYQLMQGIANQRPPQPRYTEIWDGPTDPGLPS